jgi:hypothetical protein
LRDTNLDTIVSLDSAGIMGLGSSEIIVSLDSIFIGLGGAVVSLEGVNGGESGECIVGSTLIARSGAFERTTASISAGCVDVICGCISSSTVGGADLVRGC